MTTSYFALTPGGYPNVKDDYAACATMEEVKTILEKAMYVNGLHAYNGDREPWNEHDPYPDFELIFDSAGEIQVSNC